MGSNIACGASPRRWRRWHPCNGKATQEESWSLHPLRQAFLPPPEEKVRQLWLPQLDHAEIQLVEESKAPSDNWHWPNAAHETHVAPLHNGFREGTTPPPRKKKAAGS